MSIEQPKSGGEKFSVSSGAEESLRKEIRILGREMSRDVGQTYAEIAPLLIGREVSMEEDPKDGPRHTATAFEVRNDNGEVVGYSIVTTMRFYRYVTSEGYPSGEPTNKIIEVVTSRDGRFTRTVKELRDGEAIVTEPEIEIDENNARGRILNVVSRVADKLPEYRDPEQSTIAAHSSAKRPLMQAERLPDQPVVHAESLPKKEE